MSLLDISVLGNVIVAFILYWVLEFARRMWFSALSHLPGPRLAGATYWWLFYEEAVKDGRFLHHITELHERYGIIIC